MTADATKTHAGRFLIWGTTVETLRAFAPSWLILEWSDRVVSQAGSADRRQSRPRGVKIR
jgi:hypothetical protein